MERLPDKIQYFSTDQDPCKHITGDGLPMLIMAGNDHSWDLASGYSTQAKE